MFSTRDTQVIAGELCRANMAHIRQLRPDCSLAFQAKVIEPGKVSPLCSEAELYQMILNSLRDTGKGDTLLLLYYSQA